MAAPHLISIGTADIASALTGFQDSFAARNTSWNGGWGGNAAPYAVDDYIQWPVHLAAGTWRITFFHITTAGGGVAHFDIDGVEVGTIECYSGSTTWDVVDTISSITVSETAVVPFKIAMDTTNQVTHRCIPQHVILMRTGA